MSKRRIAALIAPVFASVAIIGAGFSTWYFSSQIDQPDALTVTTSVEEGRQMGQAFTFQSTGSDINFDQPRGAQNGITYTDDTFVGFGYIAETFGEDDFLVNIQRSSDDETAGATIMWSRGEMNSYVSIDVPKTQTSSFTLTVGESQYTVYYVVYGNVTDQTNLKAAMTAAITSTTFKNVANEDVTLTADNVTYAQDLTVTALPALEYVKAFNTSDLASYLEFKGYAEGVTMNFSAFISVEAPQA